MSRLGRLVSLSIIAGIVGGCGASTPRHDPATAVVRPGTSETDIERLAEKIQIGARRKYASETSIIPPLFINSSLIEVLDSRDIGEMTWSTWSKLRNKQEKDRLISEHGADLKFSSFDGNEYVRSEIAITDNKLRVLRLQMMDGSQVLFEPHNCRYTEGMCRYKEKSYLGELYMISNTVLRNGVWVQAVKHDIDKSPLAPKTFRADWEASLGEDGFKIDLKVNERPVKAFYSRIE